MGIGDNITDEIKSRCNIIDVIGRSVTLKKTGSNYTGLCPFHNEKTPSFVVSEDKQRFTCYGCGASGDVIEFVQRQNNLTFMEAIEKLAEEYGIEYSKSAFDSDGKRAVLYEVNKLAATFFYKAFRRGQNAAISYMANRGISPETLKVFGVGYADDVWDSLYQGLKNQNIDEKIMVELGLVSNSKGKVYDKYRNRVMFPIMNTRGKVIGFGGRSIGDQMPKYLNSSESRVFQKKNNLYALNLTRQEISKADQAILVEGYMDVISLYNHGVKNATASLGTALTQNQAAMLKRYTDNVVIAYDSDAAGQKATLRGIDILREAGCKIKILTLPGAKDPDEFIKANGREAFMEVLSEALPFVDFKIRLARAGNNLETTEGSVQFLKDTAKILQSLSPVEADIYIKKIAEETRISEGAIRMEAFGEGGGIGSSNSANMSASQSQGRANRVADSEKVVGGNMLEKNLIKLMLLKSSYLEKIRPYEYAFQTPAMYKIYSCILALYSEEEEIDLKKLADMLETDEQAVLNDIEKNVQLADKEEAVLAECLSNIKKAGKKEREDEIIRMLSFADEEKNQEKIDALTKELMELQRAKLK